jgi:hypothetical protein
MLVAQLDLLATQVPEMLRGCGLAGEHVSDSSEEALRRGAFVARLRFAKFFEQLLLLRIQLGRRFDEDPRDEVAAAAAVEHAHARTTLAQLFA